MNSMKMICQSSEWTAISQRQMSIRPRIIRQLTKLAISSQLLLQLYPTGSCAYDLPQRQSSQVMAINQARKNMGIFPGTKRPLRAYVSVFSTVCKHQVSSEALAL